MPFESQPENIFFRGIEPEPVEPHAIEREADLPEAPEPIDVSREQAMQPDAIEAEWLQPADAPEPIEAEWAQPGEQPEPLQVEPLGPAEQPDALQVEPPPAATQPEAIEWVERNNAAPVEPIEWIDRQTVLPEPPEPERIESPESIDRSRIVTVPAPRTRETFWI